MKKIIPIISLVTLLGINGCGPSAEEKQQMYEELRQDSINNLITAKNNNMPDISKDTYIVDSTKKVTGIETSAMYQGIEVNTIETFYNAKLVGVDGISIEYQVINNIRDYKAKGLLFELNDNKTINLIAPSGSYYIGQRYNINYHTFKKRKKIGGENMLKMLMGTDKELSPTITKDYAAEYEGVVVNYGLNVRK